MSEGSHDVDATMAPLIASALNHKNLIPTASYNRIYEAVDVLLRMGAGYTAKSLVDAIHDALSQFELRGENEMTDDILQRLRQALAGKSALWPFVEDYPLLLDAIKEIEHLRRAVEASESRAVAAARITASKEQKVRR